MVRCRNRQKNFGNSSRYHIPQTIYSSRSVSTGSGHGSHIANFRRYALEIFPELCYNDICSTAGSFYEKMQSQENLK